MKDLCVHTASRLGLLDKLKAALEADKTLVDKRDAQGAL